MVSNTKAEENYIRFNQMLRNLGRDLTETAYQAGGEQRTRTGGIPGADGSPSVGVGGTSAPHLRARARRIPQTTAAVDGLGLVCSSDSADHGTGTCLPGDLVGRRRDTNKYVSCRGTRGAGHDPPCAPECSMGVSRCAVGFFVSRRGPSG